MNPDESGIESNTPDMPSKREQDLITLSRKARDRSSSFHRKVRSIIKNDLIVIRKRIKQYRPYQCSDMSLSSGVVRNLIETAVKFAYYRVLQVRFCEEKDISHEEIIEMRRSMSHSSMKGRDRRYDYVNVGKKYKEFHTYYPKEGVKEEEVLKYVREEFYDLIGSVGSDNHQILIESNHKGKASHVELSTGPDESDTDVPRHNYFLAGSPEWKDGEVEEDHSFKYRDYQRSHEMTSEVLSPLLNMEADLPPALLDVATVLTERFGPRAMVYWVASRYLLPGEDNQYTESLRQLGGDITPGDKERYKRDLSRKMPKMDEALSTISELREDPEWKNVMDILFGISEEIDDDPVEYSDMWSDDEIYQEMESKILEDRDFVFLKRRKEREILEDSKRLGFDFVSLHRLDGSQVVICDDLTAAVGEDPLEQETIASLHGIPFLSDRDLPSVIASGKLEYDGKSPNGDPLVTTVEAHQAGDECYLLCQSVIEYSDEYL